MVKNVIIRNIVRFSGFSIVEMLVVIAIFSILAVLATQSIATSLRGTKKSSNSVVIRQSLDYVTSVMDRQIRNASDVSPGACSHPSVNSTELSYMDADNQPQTFLCAVDGSTGVGYVNSSAIGKLTPPDVDITSCATAFTCNVGSVSGEPPSVTILLTGVNTNATGADAVTVTTTARILLRTYSVY